MIRTLLAMNRDKFLCLESIPIRSCAAMLLALAVIVRFAEPAIAQQDNVREGQRIWAEMGQCQECHGWAGNGERSTLHAEGKAPSLRLTQLTRDQIRTTIQCGRPGTAMPHFDRFAYTDKRCYDITAADLGDAVPNRAATTLQSYEIDALADYIDTKIKGAGPVTRSQCAAFFKENAGIRCEQYPDK
jgi:mono/diheme cytochrome c family protein